MLEFSQEESPVTDDMDFEFVDMVSVSREFPESGSSSMVGGQGSTQSSVSSVSSYITLVIYLAVNLCAQSVSECTDFCVDWEKFEVSVVKGRKSLARTDFAISLLAMVEAGQLTGYLATTERQADGESRYVIFYIVVFFIIRTCFFTVDGMYNLSKFLLDIFGSGGMSTWFREEELPEFVHYLKKTSSSRLPIRKAAIVIRRQPDSSVWVIGPQLQVRVFLQLTIVLLVSVG